MKMLHFGLMGWLKGKKFLPWTREMDQRAGAYVWHAGSLDLVPGTAYPPEH